MTQNALRSIDHLILTRGSTRRSDPSRSEGRPDGGIDGGIEGGPECGIEGGVEGDIEGGVEGGATIHATLQTAATAVGDQQQALQVGLLAALSVWIPDGRKGRVQDARTAFVQGLVGPIHLRAWLAGTVAE